jgi:hypothetical protein
MCNGSTEQGGRHEVSQKFQLYKRSFFALSFYLPINSDTQRHLNARRRDISSVVSNN